MVAYAIAGTVNRDLMTEPVGKGKGKDGKLRDVYLGRHLADQRRDLQAAEVRDEGKAFRENYAKVKTEPGLLWDKIKGVAGQAYVWPASTYIAEPPFFTDFAMNSIADRAYSTGSKGTKGTESSVQGARIMALFGDSITTDHISPAGSIKESSPAGQWLLAHGVQKADFNSYGARRGNHDVMLRGTFANVRIKNLMIPPDATGSREEGGVTIYQHESGSSAGAAARMQGQKMFIYDAAMRYMVDGVPTVIFAGEEYGTGSSRDWAARVRSCWVSRPWWPRVLSASTAATWWAWACCLCSSRARTPGSRWASRVMRSLM